MEKRWFNSMFYNKDGCELNKSMFGPIGGCIREKEDPVLNDTNKKKPSRSTSASCNCGNVDYFVDIRDFWSLISDDTFLIIDNIDNNGDDSSVYLYIENSIFKIDNSISFMNELKTAFSNYLNVISNYLNLDSCLNSGFKSYYYNYMSDTQSSWNNSCIDSYLDFEIRINTYFLGDTDTDNDSSLSNCICTKNESSNMRTSSYSHIRKSSNHFDINKEYKHLWVQCENCYTLSYKKPFRSQIEIGICEHCGYHLKISSSDRIKLLIDPGTWNPMNEDMVSRDPIGFHSEKDPYRDRIDSYQRKTGLTEAVQTGVGQLNGITIAIGVMDFKFMGGSMGSVVGEKITRLIEYATNKSLPVIIVCASGGARMQEGILSLMQMAKISSASYNYQLNKKLLYVSILTSPTTGGVTASFGMLGDVIISEPNAYIAFAGKRVIEQILNKKVPEGSQASEYLFHKGLLDSILSRNLIKDVLSKLLDLV